MNEITPTSTLGQIGDIIGERNELRKALEEAVEWLDIVENVKNGNLTVTCKLVTRLQKVLDKTSAEA